MKPHRIRLKGPWEYEWLTGDGPSRPDGSSASGGRIKLPIDWQTAFGTVRGRVEFRRRFGKPSRLDPDEEVWIAFDGIGGTALVRLNGRVLGRTDGAQQTARWEVARWLQPRNELVVEVEFDPQQSDGGPGGLWAPVALEIRSQ